MVRETGKARDQEFPLRKDFRRQTSNNGLVALTMATNQGRNTVRYLLIYWVPILIYLLIIFIQSSYPSIKTPRGSHLDKLLHLAAYAILGFLFARAYGASRWRGKTALIMILGVVSAASYGILDEVHQYFVPFRQADLLDVAADALGSLLGVGVYWWFALKNRCTSPDR
jgi:VanZ family protein